MDHNQIKILLVDDEDDILEFLSYNLKKQHYHVLTASDGRTGIEIARKEIPQIIILDIMMPGMDGIETCTEMRRIPELKDSILAYLTARTEDYTQIAGLDAGADDFIKKPIRPNVFLSRVSALLRRRKHSVLKNDVVEYNNILIDKEEYLVVKNGVKTELPKKEFELLYFLSKRPNKVYSREEIFNHVWGQDVIVGERTIDVHIKKIREKIGSDIIRTYKGIGYSFTAPR